MAHRRLYVINIFPLFRIFVGLLLWFTSELLTFHAKVFSYQKAVAYSPSMLVCFENFPLNEDAFTWEMVDHSFETCKHGSSNVILNFANYKNMKE